MADIDAVMRDAVESLEYAVVALNARPQAHMRQVAEELKEARGTVADMLAALEWWQAQMRDDNCDDMGKLLDDMSAKAHAAIAKAKGAAA
jgi:hypothetical protein